MPYIEALIFSKWKQDADGDNVPAAIVDIFAWANANDQYLPEGQSGLGPFGRWQDITGQANVHQRILDNLAVSVSKLEITVATAQHFANDPRIWTLGYRRFDDDGNLTFSNWDTPLTAQQRRQAANYIAANSRITKGQAAQAFAASGTRREIATRLKPFFKG